MRLADAEDEAVGSFDGPAGVLESVREDKWDAKRCGTNPGLDMTAAALPFRRGRPAGTGGAGASGSDTFCRLGRRADVGLAGSGSGTGLGSRAGALRFREVVLCRAGVVVGGGPVVEGEVSDEAIACRADDRVVLEDMSIRLCTIPSTSVTPLGLAESHQSRDRPSASCGVEGRKE